jgi:hypothetical protein
MDNLVTRAELNGQILLLIGEVREIRGEVGEVYKVLREQNGQFCDLLNREVDKREECARSRGSDFADMHARLWSLEKGVAVQDVKLQVPGWLWKSLVGVLGVCASAVGIIAAVWRLA